MKGKIGRMGLMKSDDAKRSTQIAQDEIIDAEKQQC